MAKPKVFRTQFMIYPDFQMTMIIVNSLVLMTVAIILGFSAKATFAHLSQVGIDIHLYNGHPFFLKVQNYSRHFYGILVLTLVSVLVLSNAFIIFLTHKITGPIVHLENYFQNIVKRERSPRTHLRFRDGDYFRDLPESINGAVRLLRSGVSEDTQTIPRIRRPR